MSDPLRLLLLEDSAVDAELNTRTLTKAGLVFAARRVETRADFLHALDEFRPDLILADYRLPAFDGLAALALARERAPATPFIFVTGQMGEDRAVESLQLGAADYILKDRIARLPAAVARALAEMTDRTRRQAAEAALRDSEERLRLAEANAHIGVWEWNLLTGKLEWTAELEQLYGYAPGTFPGDYEGFRIRVHPDDLAGLDAKRDEIVAACRPFDFDFRILLPSGNVRWVNCKGSAERDETGTTWRVLGVKLDITDRKQQEDQIRHLNRTLRTIIACNQELVRACDEPELLRQICRALVEVGGYLLAWVSYPAADPGSGITPIAYYGDEALFKWHEELSANPAHTAVCLAQRAWREQRTITYGPTAIPAVASLEPLLAGRVTAALALPLKHHEQRLGVLKLFSATEIVLDAAELALMENLAGDLAYGIDALRNVVERDRYLAQYGQAMKDTALAMASLVEKRDQYTAGHQRRVTALATAIARAMGLDAHTVEGLHFGGMIHDIGKIAIPAEILCKPSALTAVEYRLIQEHTQAGFEIVQPIAFPWPVAQMVLQHHERLDGSGYPAGLSGEQILLEARILAVADVVEAMSSHRPYRPGLGMDKALEEIERYKGVRYDSAAVDACLKVIRANRMQLPA